MKKHALNIAAFVWGVAEGTLFFLVPDVILTYVAVKRGARAGVVASLCAAIGAAVGGSIMFLWSASDPAAARDAVLAVPAVSEAMVAHAADATRENWFLATMLGPTSSTPYKVYATLVPHAGAALPAFALASVIARLPRFLIVSVGAALAARFLRRWLSERQLIWLLICAWLLFYAVFFARMPN